MMLMPILNIGSNYEYEVSQVACTFMEFCVMAKVRKNQETLVEGDKFVNIKKLVALDESNRLDVTLRNDKLINLIADVEVLRLAYELIKSKPGNMTRGSSGETLDGIDSAWFERTSKSILKGNLKFGPGRVVNIPKPNNPKETRQLVIASPREKVIQKAMQLVLQAVFEPMFSGNSFGFRPNLGCHDAIKYVSQRFKNRNWIVESDITKCFDMINHDLLMGFIREKVTCEATLKLISSLIKSGQISFSNLSPSLSITTIGTPQGCVLSPLLCNIFLHKLDLFVGSLIKEYDTGKTKRGTSSEYNKAMNDMATMKKIILELEVRIKSGEVNPLFKDQPIEYYQTKRVELIKHSKEVPRTNNFDESFIRVDYVRYADDFIVGIAGPKSLAITILGRIKEYLSKELLLDLKESKTHINNFNTEVTTFLGFDISGRGKHEKPFRLMSRGPHSGKRVKVTPYMNLHVPIMKLYKRLTERGFFKHNNKNGGEVKPTGLTVYQNHDHRHIIKYYNMVIRGLLSFYSPADNYSALGKIIHGLKRSCALTLALKYKLRTMAATFKKFGSRLTDPETKASIYLPVNFKRTRTFMPSSGRMTNKQQLENLNAMNISWVAKLTRSSVGLPCTVCGALPTEMHHIRSIAAIRNSKKLTMYEKILISRNRKQIPLCRLHHLQAHGKLLPKTE